VGNHGIDILFKKRLIAVCQIDLPRHDYRRVAPRRACIRVVEDVRHDKTYSAEAFYIRRHIFSPLAEKALDIEVIACGFYKDLSVARPAEAFVTLRAVGGNVDKIASLSPENI